MQVWLESCWVKTNISTRDQHSFLKALGMDWFPCLFQLLVATHIPWLTVPSRFQANNNTVSLLCLVLPPLHIWRPLCLHCTHPDGETPLKANLLEGSVSPAALMSRSAVYHRTLHQVNLNVRQRSGWVHARAGCTERMELVQLHCHTASHISRDACQNLHSHTCHTEAVTDSSFSLYHIVYPESLHPPNFTPPSPSHTQMDACISRRTRSAFPCAANRSWVSLRWPPREPAVIYMGGFLMCCFLLRDRVDSAVFSHKNWHSQAKNNTKPAPTGLQSASISFATRNQGWRYL